MALNPCGPILRGTAFTDTKRNLGLSNGTLQFHLARLEQEGIIRSRNRGTQKVFYPVGVPVPEDGGDLHEVQLRIVKAVRQLPGIGVQDLAAALGITRQHALWHLRTLAGRDLVRFERHAFSLRCYPPAGGLIPRVPPTVLRMPLDASSKPPDP